MFKYLLPVLLLLILLEGCSPQGKNRIRKTLTKEIPRRPVMVNLFRSPVEEIEIPVSGESLRTVIAEAKDRAAGDGSLLLVTALNDREKISKLTGISIENLAILLNEEQSAQVQLKIGQEYYIIIRGNSFTCVHGLLVLESVVGSIQVFPGDEILSLPESVVTKIGIQDQSITGEKAKIQLTGKYTGNQTTTGMTNLDDFLHLKVSPTGEPDQTDNENEVTSDPSLTIGENDLLPNALVLTRVVQGTNVVSFMLPFAWNKNVEEIFDDKMFCKVLLQFVPVEGDIIEITRMEEIPPVTAGLSLSSNKVKTTK